MKKIEIFFFSTFLFIIEHTFASDDIPKEINFETVLGQQLPFPINLNPPDYSPNDVAEFLEKYLPKEPELSGESPDLQNINVEQINSLIHNGNDISKDQVEDLTPEMEYLTTEINLPNYTNNSSPLTPSNILQLFHEDSQKILETCVADMEQIKVREVNHFIVKFKDTTKGKYYIGTRNLKSQFKKVNDFMRATIIAKYVGFQIQMLPSNNEIISKYNEIKNILNTTPMTQLEVPKKLRRSIRNFEIEATEQIVSVMDKTSHFINLLQTALESLETQYDNDIPLEFLNHNYHLNIRNKSIMTYRRWIQYLNEHRDYLRLDEPNIPSEIVGKEFVKKKGMSGLARMALIILREEIFQKLKYPTNHLSFQDQILMVKNYELWREYFYNRNRVHLRLDEPNISSEVVGKEFMRKQGPPALAIMALVILREEMLQPLKNKGSHLDIQDNGSVAKKQKT